MAESSSQPFSLGQKCEISIERLAYHSGHGVGRLEGFVVFVPFGVPGDRLSVEITELHASYAVGKMLAILTPSPHRRPAPCPVAGVCGGCHWQHIDYAFQIEEKQRLLGDALRQLAKPPRQLDLRPIIPAPNELRYRNRIQVHRHGPTVGFYAQGSHELIGIEDCWLAEAEVARGLGKVRERALRRNLPWEERIEIARLTTGAIEIREAPGESGGSLFSQVNERQNERLIQTVLEAVATDLNFDGAVDLFCGAGNFTLPLAERLPELPVWGVELNRHLIEAARKLSKPRNPTITWMAASVGQFLSRWSKPPQRLLVLLDPPRPGCDRQTREALLRIRPKQIVYVSCNPGTLARDLLYWMETAPYEVEFVQGLDMFPQTAHLEAVASIRLKE